MVLLNHSAILAVTAGGWMDQSYFEFELEKSFLANRLDFAEKMDQ